MAPVDGSEGQLCLVEVQGVRRAVNTGLLGPQDGVQPGDWVVVHMGFAMERLEETQALGLLAEMELALGGEEPTTVRAADA